MVVASGSMRIYNEPHYTNRAYGYIIDWLSCGFTAQLTHKGHDEPVSLPNHSFPGQA